MSSIFRKSKVFKILGTAVNYVYVLEGFSLLLLLLLCRGEERFTKSITVLK
jgi:hypothetical protein